MIENVITDDREPVERTSLLFSLLSRAERVLEYLISQGMQEPPERAMLEDEELIASLAQVIALLEGHAEPLVRQRETAQRAYNLAHTLQALAGQPELQDEEIAAAMGLLQDRLSQIERQDDIPF